MEVYQNGERVLGIRRLSMEEVLRNLVRFRHDVLYRFWLNVYRSRKEADCE